MDLEGIIQSEMRLTEMSKDMWNQKNKRDKNQNKTQSNIIIDAKRKK